jgi:hypothetical protein
LKTHQTNTRPGILLLITGVWLGVACGGGDDGGSGTRADTRGNGRDVPGGANGSSATETPAGPAAGSASATGTMRGGEADEGDVGGTPGGGSSRGPVVSEDLQGDTGPLAMATSIANDVATFTLPRAAVAVGRQLALVATDQRIAQQDRDEVGARSAIFLQRADGAEIRRRFISTNLVSPLDIDVSLDLRTLYVADFAGGRSGLGAIAVVSVLGGALNFAAEGFSPRSVTVGANDEVFFSGIDPTTGEPGVFALEGGNVNTVFKGPPLVDPSGIAAFANGRLLVADNGAFGGDGALLANDASIVSIDGGQASLFASGFATGFPAGIALTQDESTLIVSAESADRHDTLLLVDVANPELAPKQVTASFSAFQDAAGGLKRTHGKDEFSFCSLAANGGGTVFRIE